MLLRYAVLIPVAFPVFLQSGALAAEDAAISLLGEPWRETRSPVFSRDALIDTGAYQYGNPTAAEQAHLERINRARLNPQAEADRLLGGNINEGISNPVDQISLTPKQPLTFNAQLYQSARLHSQDMIEHDYFQHNSLDGRTPWDRIAAAGYTGLSAGAENIALIMASYPLNEVNSLLEMHDMFITDDNVLGRGHRVNIFNDSLREIGIGAAAGNFVYEDASYPYSWVLTCDFGSRWDEDSFVLGVVYDDSNEDGEYTAGEGLGGVSIVVRRTSDVDTAATTTATAGGYGIPLPPAAYEVSATLTDGRKLSHAMTLADRNIKIDFKKTDFPPLEACGLRGDISGNGIIGLEDAILALQIVGGRQTSTVPCTEAALNGNGRIGLPEAIHALGKAASP